MLAMPQHLALGFTSALAAAVVLGYWLRRRSSRHCLLPHSPNTHVHQKNALRPSDSKPLYVFHCGEQPLIVEDFRIEAQGVGFDVHVDTLDRFEAWVDDVRDWLSNRLNACTGRAACPPPCILIVNTGEELEVTSKLAAACLLFLARKTHGSATPLDGFRYAVLGLGDSNHLATSHRSISWASGKDCNQCGELFDRWFEQLGGTRLVRRGESDLRTDHQALGPWMGSLWAALKKREP